MPLYDFVDGEGHVTEAIRPSDVRWIACPRCDLTAERQFSSRFGIVGPTTDTRGMFRRYQEAAAEIDHNATKYEQSGGEAAPLPNLWQQSKAYAEAVVAAGENPVTKSA